MKIHFIFVSMETMNDESERKREKKSFAANYADNNNEFIYIIIKTENKQYNIYTRFNWKNFKKKKKKKSLSTK